MVFTDVVSGTQMLLATRGVLNITLYIPSYFTYIFILVLLAYRAVNIFTQPLRPSAQHKLSTEHTTTNNNNAVNRRAK